jgi:hypothetical protein
MIEILQSLITVFTQNLNSTVIKLCNSKHMCQHNIIHISQFFHKTQSHSLLRRTHESRLFRNVTFNLGLLIYHDTKDVKSLQREVIYHCCHIAVISQFFHIICIKYLIYITCHVRFSKFKYTTLVAIFNLLKMSECSS